MYVPYIVQWPDFNFNGMTMHDIDVFLTPEKLPDFHRNGDVLHKNKVIIHLCTLFY